VLCSCLILPSETICTVSVVLSSACFCIVAATAKTALTEAVKTVQSAEMTGWHSWMQL
jgi:hypothetical protein